MPARQGWRLGDSEDAQDALAVVGLVRPLQTLKILMPHPPGQGGVTSMRGDNEGGSREERGGRRGTGVAKEGRLVEQVLLEEAPMVVTIGCSSSDFSCSLSSFVLKSCFYGQPTFYIIHRVFLYRTLMYLKMYFIFY